MIEKQKEQTMPTINTLDATTSGAAAQTECADADEGRDGADGEQDLALMAGR